MSTDIHYPKPPIREAIVDFRCPVGDGELQEIGSRLEVLANSFADEFPIRLSTQQYGKAAERFAHTIAIGQDPEKFVWQIRPDGMLLSRLPVYECWDEVQQVGRRLWHEYRRVVREARVSELVVRAINEIALPAGQIKLEDFLHTYPHVSDAIDEPINRFVMNIGLPIATPDGQAMITIAPGLSQALGCSILLLDISVSCRDENAIQTDCWEVADQLRLHRNRLFEASITDNLRARFNV